MSDHRRLARVSTTVSATATAAMAVMTMAAVMTAMVAGARGATIDVTQPTVYGVPTPTPSTAGHVLVDSTSRPFNGSADNLKKVMWKRCMSKNYLTCVKLTLVHLVDRLEKTNDSYSLVPGVTVFSQKQDASTNEDLPVTSAGRDSSEVFDKMLVDKLGRYFNTLTLNVKLLDDSMVQSARKLGEAAADASLQSGRGKKQKYAQSILMAGWVTGAMLLALGMKAIAVLAGKALMTALMSLLLSALASFRGGHSEPKSTTYEIVTKPVYSHSHSTDDAHAAGSQNSPTYRRSIGGPFQAAAAAAAAAVPSSEEADHVVYRIHASDKTPIYIPIERRRRR